MRTPAKRLLGVTILVSLTLAWGYWYSTQHAYLRIHVDDYSLASPRQAYGTPHNVTLTFFDNDHHELAIAKSVEPAGYILAIHPSTNIGTCEQYTIKSSANGSNNHSSCYKKYSAWSATWGQHVHHANVIIGSCQLHDVPVTIYTSNTEWLLWWVPLPHIGGLPRQYLSLALAVDSRACTVVTQ